MLPAARTVGEEDPQARQQEKTPPHPSGSRVPWLLGLLAALVAVGGWVNGEMLARWYYRRQPAGELLAQARSRPADLLLLKSAGERLLETGRPDAAAELLVPASTAHPDEVELQVLAGRAAWRSGDPRAGGLLLKQALDRAPENVDARYWTAEFLYSQGYARTAAELLGEVTRIRPGHAGAWLRLGEIAVKDQTYPQALGHLAKAERLAAGEEAARWRASALKALGRTAEAEAAARLAVRRRPTPEGLLLLADIVQARGGAGAYREAQPFLLRAAVQGSTYEALTALAVNHQALGEHREAVRVLRRMLRLLPYATQGYLRLTVSYKALGETALARAVERIHRLLAPREDRAERAAYRVRIQPDRIEPRINLVRTYLEIGREDLALSALEQAEVRFSGPELAALAPRCTGKATLSVPALPLDPSGDSP